MLGFEIGLLTLFFVTGLAYYNVRVYLAVNDWALQTVQINIAIDSIAESIYGAESAQRGFLLTGHSSLLTTFDAEKKRTSENLARLNHLLQISQPHSLDEPFQALQSAVDSRIGKLDRTVSAYLTQGKRAAFLAMSTGMGEKLMKDVNARIENLRSLQRESQFIRTQATNKAAHQTLLVIIGGYVLSFLFLLLARWRMRSDMRQLKEKGVELMHARNEAEAANRSKSQFLANLSHEIRTPLNAVIGMSAVLEAGQLSSEHREAVTLIQRSSRALLNLIQDVLDLARIDVGQIKLDLRAFRIEESLADVHAMLAPQVPVGVKLTWSADGHLPERLIGDPNRIGQILLNLAGNAVKFTESGDIQISATIVARNADLLTVRFSVRDTGPGILLQDQAKLFQPFTQLGPGTGKPGTGLGLSICKRLVDAMGGTIGVSSEPGRGSIFWFELRLSDASRSTQGASLHQPRAALPKLRGRVLIVDDNQINQIVASRLLDLMGIDSEVANDGEAALERLSRGGYNAVLMDCELPILDGCSATQEWRRIERERGLPTLPIIAMTAHVQEDERKRTFESGMDACLTKPLDVDLLATTLSRWLKPASIETHSNMHGLPLLISEQADHA